MHIVTCPDCGKQRELKQLWPVVALKRCGSCAAKVLSSNPRIVKKRWASYYKNHDSVKLSESELRSMKEAGLPNSKIAKAAGCTVGTLVRRLKDYGIKSPPWVKQRVAKHASDVFQEKIAKNGHPGRKLFLGKEELEDLYIRQKLSATQIAKQYDVSQATISNTLREHGITVPMTESHKRAARNTRATMEERLRGHVRNREGYRAIKQDHPNSDKRGYVLEHRLVMEHSVGRQLEDSEEVHHLNFNKSDNRIENLVLFRTPDHRRFHNYLQRFGAFAAGLMDAPPDAVRFQMPAFFRGAWITECYLTEMYQVIVSRVA